MTCVFGGEGKFGSGSSCGRERETVAMSAIDMDVGVLDWRGRLWSRGLLGEEQPSGKVKTLSLILG